MKALVLLVRIGLGGLLLWAGLAKITHPYEFLASVYGYRLVGPTTGLMIAAVVPWLEAVSGCCLLTGVLVEGSLMVATALLGVFAIAVTSAWLRHLGIRCGCFGNEHDVISGLTVLRALGLFSLSFLGLAVVLRVQSGSHKEMSPSGGESKAGESRSGASLLDRFNPASHRPSSPSFEG
jgi:uncharacterized membrane protein YphA (DoxX/SURF4 family)